VDAVPRRASFLPFLLLPVLAAAPRAAAQPPVTGPIQLPESTEEGEEAAGERFVSVRLALFGSVGTYSMREFNDNIDVLTLSAREQWGAPEIKLERISDGVGGGAGLHAFFRGKVFLAAEYERLTGTSETGGRLGSADIQVPATAYMGTLGYCIYAKKVRFGFGAGGGFYDADGSAEFIVDEDVVEKYTMTGDTIGQHYVSFVDTPLLGKFRVTAMVGYRRASIDDPDVVQEVFVPDPDDPSDPPVERFLIQGEGSSLDWSGFMARLALAYTVF
jgi:hypothetical protein